MYMSRVTQCWNTDAPSQVLKSNPYYARPEPLAEVIAVAPEAEFEYLERNPDEQCQLKDQEGMVSLNVHEMHPRERSTLATKIRVPGRRPLGQPIHGWFLT